MKNEKYQIMYKEFSIVGDGAFWKNLNNPYDDFEEALNVALNTDFNNMQCWYAHQWIIVKLTFNEETFKTTKEIVYPKCREDISEEDGCIEEEEEDEEEECNFNEEEEEEECIDEEYIAKSRFSITLLVIVRIGGKHKMEIQTIMRRR